MSMILAAILAAIHFTSKIDPYFADYPSGRIEGDVNSDNMPGASDSLDTRLTIGAADGFAAAVNAVIMRQSVPFMRGTYSTDVLNFAAIPGCEDWGRGTLGLGEMTSTNFWMAVSEYNSVDALTNVVWDFQAGRNARMMRDLREAWGLLGYGMLKWEDEYSTGYPYMGAIYPGYFSLRRNQYVIMPYIAPLFYAPSGSAGENREGLYDAVAGYTCRHAPGVRWSFSSPNVLGPDELLGRLAPTNFLSVYGADDVYLMLSRGGNGYSAKCALCGDFGPAFGANNGFYIGPGEPGGYIEEHVNLRPSWSNVVMAAVGVDIGNADMNAWIASRNPGRFSTKCAQWLNASLAALDTVVFGDGIWPRPKWMSNTFSTACTNEYTTPPLTLENIVCASDTNGLFRIAAVDLPDDSNTTVTVRSPFINVVPLDEWRDAVTTPYFFAEADSPNDLNFDVPLTFTGVVAFAATAITQFMTNGEEAAVSFLGPPSLGIAHNQLNLISHFDDNREIDGYGIYTGGYGIVADGPSLVAQSLTARIAAHVTIGTSDLQPWGNRCERLEPYASRRATFPPYALRHGFAGRFAADVTTFAHLHGFYTNSTTSSNGHYYRAYGMENATLPGGVETHFMETTARSMESEILALAVVDPAVFKDPLPSARMRKLLEHMAYGSGDLNKEYVHGIVMDAIEAGTNFSYEVAYQVEHIFRCDNDSLFEWDEEEDIFKQVEEEVEIPFSIRVYAAFRHHVPEEEIMSHVHVHGKGDYFSIGAVKIPYPAMKNTWRESQ